MRSSDDRHAVGNCPPTPLIVRSLQQSSVGCHEFAKQFLVRNFCNVPPAAAGENGTREVKNLCETCGLYLPDHKIFKRDTHRAVFYDSILWGRGIQLGAPSPNNVH